jgi:hypothetical protein
MTSNSAPSLTQGTSIHGNVHGGRQPISGAHIYLLAAASTAYGASSVSLLDSADTGHADFLGAYTTSNTDGSFSISGAYTCTPNTQVYLYAQGGDPGAGPNDAVGLLAILGNCPVAGNFAAATPLVSINEVTTVAAAYAFAGYATDATHVASSGTPLALAGIANAFASAANITDLTSGSALDTTPAGNGTAPQSTTNTLANILASCINSTGPSSVTCSTLLGKATSDGTMAGTIPTNTATAIINIAHNPAANVASLFNLIPAVAPFVPSLVVQPTDFSLALKFTGGGIKASQSLAIDSLGNVWAADDNDALLKYSSLGVPLSGSIGFTNGYLNHPFGIAIDSSSNIWLSNSGYGPMPLTRFDGSGNFITAPGAPVYDTFYALTISPTGDLLIPSSYNGNGVYDFSATGVYRGLYATSHPVDGLTVQTNGTIWTSDDGASTLSELSNNGTLLSGPGFASGILNPGPVTAGPGGTIWALNAYGGISVVDSAGAPLFTANTTSGASHLVFDGAGRAWFTTMSTSPTVTYQLQVLSNTGTSMPGASAYTSSNHPFNDIQIDGSGNVWLSTGDSLTELVGAAAPVVTPAINAVANNAVGTRP